MNNLILTKKILNWYDNNKRILPWRKKCSQKKREYFTLVSEFMLQQTQVTTVIPYFNNFIHIFIICYVMINFSFFKISLIIIEAYKF